MTCSQEGMTVDVDECVYTDGSDTVTVGFGSDQSCQSIEYNGTLSVTTPLDGCGSTTSTKDGLIVFSNNLEVTSRIHPVGLVTANDVKVHVGTGTPILFK